MGFISLTLETSCLIKQGPLKFTEYQINEIIQIFIPTYLPQCVLSTMGGVAKLLVKS